MIPLLAGCGSSFDGTWLFRFNPNTDAAGDCVDDSSDITYTYTGEQFTWVDIYSSSTGELVVLLEEALVGTADGSTLEASWSDGYSSDTYSYTNAYDLSAELAGGILSGEVEESYDEDNDGDTYRCVTTYSFDAERNVSAADRYVDN